MMIPSVLALQVRRGVEDFLRTTFPISTPLYHGLVDRLLDEPGGVFKGPFLSVGLPFCQSEITPDFFPDIPLKFHPYAHQERAFRRLSGPSPLSTLVATGTGSGKTECFLYPILDHCRRHRGEPGIKAILVYPMNALASDQATRLARLIHANPKLRGFVTAGLFVGQSERSPHMVMGSENIVTDKETLRNNPPDILLTNYKMLDYLLIRPRDHRLWQGNGPETLQYLVVDELHTFDGAQGTDLACLIRRLKVRLGAPTGHLCCVGTSATLGDGGDGTGAILAYASRVFGETFDEQALISESRLSAGEFLERSLISRVDVPMAADIDRLDPERYGNPSEYVRAQHELWFGESIPEAEYAHSAWRVALGDKLKEHYFFHNFLKSLEGKPADWSELLGRLERTTAALRGASAVYRERLLASLLALVSEARVWPEEGPEKSDKQEGENGVRKPIPFLQVRIQLWLRELRRMVVEVGRKPRLRFADDLSEAQRAVHLPLVYCRECGSAGWAGFKRRHDSEVRTDLRDFYSAFFQNDHRVVFLFPDEKTGPAEVDGEILHLCPGCLRLVPGLNMTACPDCGGEELIRVLVPDSRMKRGDKWFGVHDCPYCGSVNSLTLLGSRAASLTSVLIGQLFASGFNDDKKLLTFSDSVQDAAHRAGFFGARTWRFSFRAALTRVLRAEGNSLPLSGVSKAFEERWMKEMDKKTFVATFLAPNMAWLRDWDHLKKHGSLPAGSKLVEDVNRRIDWEIHAEFGLDARVGRTLEKSGAAVASPDPRRVDKAVGLLVEPLRNEIEGLQGLTPDRLRLFLVGLLTQFKNQGAVMHPALKNYIENWGSTWHFAGKRPWMPRKSPGMRLPIFLTTKAGTSFSRVVAQHGKRSWLQRWAEKCFLAQAPLLPSLIRPFYDIVLKKLVECDLLVEMNIKGDRVWGINPDGLRVNADVLRLRCPICEYSLSVAAADRATWENAPCLRHQCDGSFQIKDNGLDYYGRLYALGDIRRIFAEEHTGLLARERREEVEDRFKADEKERKPWDPNLLSCTPTLEMGIDIGDLSSLILCSVPPSQASFLQRIGRAGRRDGNALATTVANAAPHDLYFFAEPVEMLSGLVDPPGVFLNASAVLERQFTAFCLDRWSETGVTDAMLPDKLGRALGNLEPYDDKKFPHNFLRFIETHRDGLFQQFIAMFPVELSQESKDHIQSFSEGDKGDEGSLACRIAEGLFRLKREKDTLQRKIRLLGERAKRKKADPAQDPRTIEEIEELGREKAALQGLVRGINDRNIFNFLSDEGLIPNYAFPEAGVTLKSVIYSRKENPDEKGGKYETFSDTYERSAASAIHELAPANSFYAGGRKLQIDQVDMETSEVETWRLCNNCSYAELVVAGEEKSACPRCGSTVWPDEGRKRQMLRMRQVISTMSDRDSRFGDDSDDREPSFFQKQVLVDFDDRNIADAWRLDVEELPFGFEFISRSTFREINFGEKSEYAPSLTVAGVELPRKGFTLCRVCGKVQNAKGQIEHALTCTARDQESDANLIDIVYLYREFTSEAIRFLLPVTSFADSEKRLHSFVAALHLGLKLQFGGSIDHLQSTCCDEPIPDSNYRKQYLVLYDTVPGGTGYLKQLMRSEASLLEVLEKALAALKSCACANDPSKDGCYRCLFAYRSSYHMAETSWANAVELLSEILGHRDKLVKTDTLRNVPVNALFDSELEGRFIEALRKEKGLDVPVVLTKELVNGKPGYFYRIGERAYYLEPQASLGPNDGVVVPSRADFLFRPARLQDGAKPIAVFTDGFLYHRDRVGLDTAQRMALARSGRYLTWSLTWKDVENRFKPKKDYYGNYLEPAGEPGRKMLRKLLERSKLTEFATLDEIDSFGLLQRYLANPSEDNWQRYALIQAITMLDLKGYESAEDQNRWKDEYEGAVFEGARVALASLDSPLLFGLQKPEEGAIPLRIFTAAATSSLNSLNVGALVVSAVLDDRERGESKSEFEKIWNGFLRLLNVFQFLPESYFLAVSGLAMHEYDSLITRKEKPSPPPGPVEPEDSDASDEWSEVFELCIGEARDLAKKLAAWGWPVPEPGFELVGSGGEVVAEAELAWEAMKVAILRDAELDGAEIFKEHGWQVVFLQDAIADPKNKLTMPSAA